MMFEHGTRFRARKGGKKKVILSFKLHQFVCTSHYLMSAKHEYNTCEPPQKVPQKYFNPSYQQQHETSMHACEQQHSCKSFRFGSLRVSKVLAPHLRWYRPNRHQRPLLHIPSKVIRHRS